jgi:hypothetical protein
MTGPHDAHDVERRSKLLEVSHNATLFTLHLKIWNESGTKEARIADSHYVRLRSPQYVAHLIVSGTTSSSDAHRK